MPNETEKYHWNPDDEFKHGDFHMERMNPKFIWIGIGDYAFEFKIVNGKLAMIPQQKLKETR